MKSQRGKDKTFYKVTLRLHSGYGIQVGMRSDAVDSLVESWERSLRGNDLKSRYISLDDGEIQSRVDLKRIEAIVQQSQ
jgi:hypothetical protein